MRDAAKRVTRKLRVPYLKQTKKEFPRRHTKNDPRSGTALPHRPDCGPASRRVLPRGARAIGRGAHPGARALRPPAQFSCDGATGHPAGGNRMSPAEAEPRRRCRSSRVEELGEALTPALGGLHPLTRKGVHRGLRVHWKNNRQFLPRMICPAGQGRCSPEANEKE